MHVTMQTLGRIAIIGGGALVAGIGGWLASVLSYEYMYRLSLIIPLISVAGVVTAGSFVFKREGEPEKIIKTGDAFYEPAGVVTERFDNASSTEPAELIAFYLTDAKDRPLIELLGAK